ncbi:MAG: TRAP transporter fused permease subunit [Syntrophales bacterium]|jgi:TRAP transporter 4TM/12TM fusion protein|nr:TRAP transporter fused permease subunit [Syntrophales bacterium]
MEEKSGNSFRQLTGITKIFADIILTLMPIIGITGVLDLPSYFHITIHSSQYVALIFGLVLASAFLIAPAGKAQVVDNRLPWYDLVFAIISVAAGLYVAINYQAIMVDVGIVMTHRIVLGVCTVLLTIEASRRIVGLPFILIIIFFLFYALFSSYFPGDMATKSISYGNLAVYLYLDPQGIIGLPMEISASLVLVYLLFGQAINSVGVNRLFNDLAFALLGKYRGGPAKVAVLSSALFGMISGSAVANVATTGVFTIPLMKKTGYKAYFAGAVEAVASTGGQIMPPIMGASAFIMATFIGEPYAAIALAAVIPAILYYLSVFIQIDLRAGKDKLVGFPESELPKLRQVLKDNWPFTIPFLVLVYTLFVMWMEAETAGILSAFVTVILGFVLSKRTGFTLGKIVTIFRDSGRALLEVGVAAAGAGIIIGVLSITGLAYTFSSVLVHLAGGNMFLLFLLAAVGATILGMGMTVVASYLLMVVLVAPALTAMGVPPLLAHFFVFYYGVLSFLTPPVCLAAYAAASIAGANMMQTAVQSMKLGIAAYLVPFFFIYRPGLLLMGKPADIIQACIVATIGVCFFSIGLEGFLFRNLQPWKRAFIITGGLFLFSPGLITDAIGLCLGFPIIFFEWRSRKAIN